MPGVFNSYRRDDNAGHAGRPYDRLRQHSDPTGYSWMSPASRRGTDFVEDFVGGQGRLTR